MQVSRHLAVLLRPKLQYAGAAAVPLSAALNWCLTYLLSKILFLGPDSAIAASFSQAWACPGLGARIAFSKLLLEAALAAA